MPLHLNLLGQFRLRQGDQPVAGFDHARLQHLLAYLVLHRATSISRQQLAFLFWPDSADRQALKNLRTLLTRLRHALPDANRFIDVTTQTSLWRPDESLTVDVAEFDSALAQAAATQERGAQLHDPSDRCADGHVICYVNAYENSRTVIRAVIQKIMGESEFKGQHVNEHVWCEKWETRR